MIDFYSDGTTVGVALSGWTMVFVLIFLLFIILNFISTKVLSMILKIDINNNINYTQMSRDKKLKDLGIN